MMSVISQTDFIQRQFTFTSETKKSSGSYKAHHAPTKKIQFVFLSIRDIKNMNVFGL